MSKDYVAPSSELKELRRMRTEQARTAADLNEVRTLTSRNTGFLAELDDPIQRVFLRLQLSKTNNFADLCPIDIGLSATKLNEHGELHGFQFRIQDFEWTKVTNNQSRVAAYSLAVSPLLPKGHTNVQRQAVATRESTIQRISVPIALWAVESKPFKTIRDFNNAGLVFHFSQQLTSRLEKVELIVNGWSIFEIETKNANWRLDDVRGLPFFPEVKLYALLASKPDSIHPPVATWSVELYGKTLRYYSAGAGPLTLSETASFRMIGADSTNK